jgi:hypothetical protein
MTEAAQRAVRGSNPLQFWFFALSSKSPTRALVFGAHTGREVAAREARSAGGMVKGGFVHDGLAYVDKDEIDDLLNRLRAARTPQGHAQNAGRRRGRIVRRVDPIQEKLGIELLRGGLIELDGEVYRVGGLLDGGDKVELWRESRAHVPNVNEARPYVSAVVNLADDWHHGRLSVAQIRARAQYESVLLVSQAEEE